MQEVLGFSSLLVLLALAAPTTMPACFLSCLLPGLLPEARLAPGIAPSGMHLAQLCGGLPVEGAEMLLPSMAQWSQHWGRRVTLSLPCFHPQSCGCEFFHRGLCTKGECCQGMGMGLTPPSKILGTPGSRMEPLSTPRPAHVCGRLLCGQWVGRFWPEMLTLLRVHHSSGPSDECSCPFCTREGLNTSRATRPWQCLGD